MFSPFERLFAWRYLRARRQEGFISVIALFSFLGIALGVAALIIVMSVMNGFRQELTSQILGINGHIAVFGTMGPMDDYDVLRKKIEKLPGITQVAPVVENQAMAIAHGQAMGVQVNGMFLEDLKNRKNVSEKIIAGGMKYYTTPSSILVGARLAEKMGLSIGDKLTIVAPEGTSTAFGTVPRTKTFTVAGIFEVGMYQYDSGFVFVPIETAQKFFQMGEGVSGLEIFTTDPNQKDKFKEEIIPLLHDHRARMFDWQEANSKFFTAVEVERNVMFVILTLIILVASFNVISSLIMLVKDKGRDIAILRTMGASRGMIMRIFFLTGSTLGLVGTTLGSVLALLFCWNIERIRKFIESLSGSNLFNSEIYFLSKLPAKVDTTEVALVIGIALGLTFLASLYPSWRASKLDPVEALRYE
ncbi:Lipoprotein-releasing system transmembrane protein LolE [Candidatus Bealeia paramacronuclearis]|uniref:Lipoprotein-releasing system transmembrane protein LolE n=1 Tax=Candidatus Bealeia paramacronuclearis TaxID=1921001 RepID=A0ABZ2C5D6_9PROT|nr:Lipoprotein-releasing system transmembrane protein LolE [Candidatus Bealeia paramacronuclearis]